MTLEQLLSEIDGLDAQATKGPWGGENARDGWNIFAGPAYVACIATFHTGVEPDRLGLRNMQFACLSRTALPMLAKILREIRRVALDQAYIDNLAERILNEAQPVREGDHRE